MVSGKIDCYYVQPIQMEAKFKTSYNFQDVGRYVQTTQNAIGNGQTKEKYQDLLIYGDAFFKVYTGWKGTD